MAEYSDNSDKYKALRIRFVVNIKSYVIIVGKIWV